MNKIGKVWLVGAGPSLDSMTKKGWEVLTKADAVCYDDLLDQRLLSWLKEQKNIECHYVGKRQGAHSANQREIEKLLVQLAREGKDVVRLKGGDSFVFGRGGEELLFLMENNIPCEVVPGVTSAIAVPEHFGIPVTHRGVAQSFTVVTGHSASEREENYEALAQLQGTLVFLMGAKRMDVIAEKLMSFGKAKDTPVSILSRGFAFDEKRMDTTLGEISKVKDLVETPAIFVVGEVADFHLKDENRGAFGSLSVTVTGTASFAKKAAENIEALGGQVVLCSHLRIEPIEDSLPKDFSSRQWMVFTSPNGVRIFFREFFRQKRDLRQLGHMRFATLGSGTALELEQYGFYSDFTPSHFTGKCLGEELGELLKQEKNESKKDVCVVILRAKEGNEDITNALASAGVSYEDIPIYETMVYKEQVETPKTDYVIFASASGVKGFYEAGGSIGKSKVICIGELTAKKVKEYYPSYEPKIPVEYSIDGIIELLKEGV